MVDPVFTDIETDTDIETGRFWMIGDTRRGAYAEFVVVEQTQLLALPDEVSAVDASCLPVAYGTSHRMMITPGKIQPGRWLVSHRRCHGTRRRRLVFFVGQVDDMFVCGGENNYPGDVEQLLERH